MVTKYCRTSKNILLVCDDGVVNIIKRIVQDRLNRRFDIKLPNGSLTMIFSNNLKVRYDSFAFENINY